MLYTFTGGADGANPAAPVVLDGAGRYLYGTAVGLLPTTPAGGAGVVFRITLP